MAMKLQRCVKCRWPRRAMVRADVLDQDSEVKIGLKWLCVPCLLDVLRVPLAAYQMLPALVRERLEKKAMSKKDLREAIENQGVEDYPANEGGSGAIL
jgi:hypothetical protein